MRNRAAFLSLFVLIAAGCASDAPKQESAPAPAKRLPAASYNLAGYPRAFKEGYNDACSNPRKRHEQRFKDDSDYRMGWNDGNSMCRQK